MSGEKGVWHLNERGQLVSETPVWRAIETTRLLRKIGLISAAPTELELAFPDL